MFCRTLLFALCCTVSLPAAAIVNIEALRLTPEPGFTGSIEAAVSGKRGTVESDTVNAAVRADWHRGAHTAFLIGEREYGKTNDVRSADSVFAHLREIYALSDSTALEGYAQQQSDEFLLLKSRTLAGAGGRFRLWRIPETANLFLGLGGFIYREITNGAPGAGEDNERGVRVNTYVNYTHRWSDHVYIMSTTYYQPRTGDPADVRALEQAALAVDLTKHLELKLTLDFTLDSEPPPGVEKTETSYRTWFKYQF